MGDDEISEKVRSVADYVKRAELSDEELGQLIAMLAMGRISSALQSALGELDF